MGIARRKATIRLFWSRLLIQAKDGAPRGELIMGRRQLLTAGLALATAVFLDMSLGTLRAEPVTITILHTNDVYEISPVEGQGGLAELGTLLKTERAKSPNTVTTFGGDLISPSVMSGLTKGTQMIEIYNALGVAAAVPGNHEFDFGPEIAVARFKESTFPWIGSNVLGKDGKPAEGLIENKIVEVGGYKLGFLGVLTDDTVALSSPGPDITFAPINATAEAEAKKLRAEGADLVIALTHQDLADDRDLLRTVKGVDIVLGGHDHDPMTIYEGGKLIVKAGYDAHYLAAIDIEIDRVKKQDKEAVVWRPSWRYESTSGVTPDPEIKKIVDKYNARLDSELGVVIGKTDVALDTTRETVRTTESNFGNLIADAIKEAVGADLAIIGGGGIRGNKIYDAGTMLTRKDILTELPFGNGTVLTEVVGSDVRAALENGVSQVEDKAGRFPQVAGVIFTYDMARKPGDRVTKVEVDGQPLDNARTYKVATNDYMLTGGDGYASLTKGKVLIDASGAKLMASTVMDYVTAKKEVAPKVEGRITRLN
jgi:2',3'-cyclic-nucleotide 2'-phosphodiesterase (5'-nucleotidase family)